MSPEDPRPRPDSSTSSTHSVSDPEQDRENEVPAFQDKPEDAFSSSGFTTRAIENEETVITSIRATDLTLELRRIPAGFCAIVLHSGLEWRTENKPVHVDSDVVEWNGLIPIPSDPSASISLAVQASFEFQPMLGHGEQLRQLTVTVEKLLDHSAKGLPFTFFVEKGNVSSPCSSLLVTVRRQNRESVDLLPSRVPEPHCSVTQSRGQLEEATNKGHSAFSRYQRHGAKQDLEHAIEQFQRALDICPPDDLCYAVVQSNMGMVRLVHYRANDTDASFDAPLALYRSALVSRPTGHPDRPSTLIQLAAVHLAQFEKRRDEADRTQAEAFLREATCLSSVESHEHRAAVSMLGLHAGSTTGAVQAGAQSSVRQGSSGLADADPRNMSLRPGDLANLQQTISVLEPFIRSTSLRDDRYLAGLTKLATALRYRFNHLGELSDLEESISRQRDAVNLIPDGHPDKPRSLNDLGIFLFARFENLGRLNDLGEAISSQQDALDLSPAGHPDRFSILNNLGNSFATRFQCLGEPNDLEEAIQRQQDAIDLIPNDHPGKPISLNNLGISLRTRFQCLGELNDLEEAISRQRDALKLIPDSQANKSGFLNILGNSLFTRFEQLGDLNDLEEAISKQRNAVRLTPDRHPNKRGYLNNLGNTLVTRFEHLGELTDLEEAVSRQQDAVNLTPDDHPNKPIYLSNLGHSLFTRFRHVGELTNLEDAISRQRGAVDLIPGGHLEEAGCLINLGNSLSVRFGHLGELRDLEEAISRQQDAVDLTPDGHAHKPAHLNDLGMSFLTRFKHLGEMNDLKEAISKQQNALDLTPDGHPYKPSYLNNLSISFHKRFEQLGELSDLEEALLRQRNAVDLTPNDHPNKPCYLSSLGNSFLTRFKHLGDLSDLEGAIASQQDAVVLTPDGHLDKPIHLNNLAASFFSRFQRFGELSDLEEALSKKQDVIDLTPDGHPDKLSHLGNLGVSLFLRFERLGKLSDLEDAISRQRGAVDLTPDGHPEKTSHLMNLSSSLVARFKRLGELNDLEEAISRQRDAVTFTPDRHSDMHSHLNALGNYLLARFWHLGEVADLKEAILRQQEALGLVSDGHPRRPDHLSNLAMSFFIRFKRFGGLSDLEEAILKQQDALDLTSDGHPDKPSHLNNLGVFFFTRFKSLENLGDLEKAISRQRKAVDLEPEGHFNRPGCMNNLGSSFFSRFEHLGEFSDLEEAISMQQDAVDLTPDGHPDKPECLNNLGHSFKARFQCFAVPSDLEQAVLLYSKAACATTGPITVRFGASRRWIYCASRLRHHSLLHAYSIAILLLPQLAWIGLSLAHRYHELVQGADVVREAAAAALESGHPETAVEWLEQGRSVVWGELFQLRGSYDELSSAHPDHARRLRELSTQLEHAGAAREIFLALPTEHRPTASLQQDVDRQRTLAIERDKLLQDIRELPGFERFLLHKEFSQIRASAHSGPIVILNATVTRCDALIVLADVDHVIHVPLPHFSLGRSKTFQTSLKSLVRDARDTLRDGRPIPQEHSGQWESILSPLWKCVVKPVLDAMAFSIPGELSRIFWCPTGPFIFLPIHAAGLYDSHHSLPGHKVYDFVISSYVPTLNILAPSPELGTALSGNLRLLAVRQPLSDGQRKLPGVISELERIRTIIRNSPSGPTLTESSVGTVEEVLSLMEDADWVHFACHGIQDDVNPTESGLCLADQRRLRLSDMISLSRRRGGLAFLSACQTAKGDEDLSDEAIHVAAGMLFAGYGGVVGTMWSISDRFAPDVAKDVYEQLFRGGTTPDYREAARALHVAVGRLRQNNKVSFQDWLPFIHVGL